MRSIERELSTAQRAILFDNNNIKNYDSECVADCDCDNDCDTDGDSDCDGDCDGGRDCDCDCDTPDQAVALDNVQSLWTNASAKAEHAICPLRLIEFLAVCFDRKRRQHIALFPAALNPTPLEVSQRGPNVDGLKKAASDNVVSFVSLISTCRSESRKVCNARIPSGLVMISVVIVVDLNHPTGGWPHHSPGWSPQIPPPLPLPHWHTANRSAYMNN